MLYTYVPVLYYVLFCALLNHNVGQMPCHKLRKYAFYCEYSGAVVGSFSVQIVFNRHYTDDFPHVLSNGL